MFFDNDSDKNNRKYLKENSIKAVKNMYKNCYNIKILNMGSANDRYFVKLSFDDNPEAKDKDEYELLPNEREYRQLFFDKETMDLVEMASYSKDI